MSSVTLAVTVQTHGNGGMSWKCENIPAYPCFKRHNKTKILNAVKRLCTYTAYNPICFQFFSAILYNYIFLFKGIKSIFDDFF